MYKKAGVACPEKWAVDAKTPYHSIKISGNISEKVE